MDSRTLKLALARRKLKDHQEKKVFKNDIAEKKNSEEEAEQRLENEEPVEIMTGEGIQNAREILEPNSISVITTDRTTEALISDKRSLEMQVYEMQNKILHINQSYENLLTQCNALKNVNIQLESELKAMKEQFAFINTSLNDKDQIINEAKLLNMVLSEEKNNLVDQLDFTKNIVSTKESESARLTSELNRIQNLLEAAELRIQQLTSDSMATNIAEISKQESVDALKQKNAYLEQQLKSIQKERDQISSHYEHYVTELNEQLKVVTYKSEQLSRENEMLSIRENSLIEQISEMEKTLQHHRIQSQNALQSRPNSDDSELNDLKRENKDLITKYENLQKSFSSLEQAIIVKDQRIYDLEMEINTKSNNENICVTKLSADITNDKVAAQLATEQNKKLKIGIQDLEEAFVKMSKDKLQLTEKLDAEKFLNRELTIKLAENVERATDMQTKLLAKDEEMIRLLNNYRELEKKLEELLHHNEPKVMVQTEEGSSEITPLIESNKATYNGILDKGDQNKDDNLENAIDNIYNNNETGLFPKEHAMLKLQERFLRIMDEVANLSDEKHRLEHIITQLQNETDTICEYVALYQQQRSLLKQRDEERSSQIKIFQSECEKMKSELKELSDTILRLSKDKELAELLKSDSRSNDISKVLNLLDNLKKNFLINPENPHGGMNNFYPCACCSGNLIDV